MPKPRTGDWTAIASTGCSMTWLQAPGLSGVHGLHQRNKYCVVNQIDPNLITLLDNPRFLQCPSHSCLNRKSHLFRSLRSDEVLLGPFDLQRPDAAERNDSRITDG